MDADTTDAWIREIWPSPQHDKALAQLVIKKTWKFVFCNLAKKTNLRGDELKAEVQIGIWRTIESFDGEGSFIAWAINRSRVFCASAAVAHTVPIVWPGQPTKRRDGLTLPHTTGWLRRQKADPAMAAAQQHTAFDESRGGSTVDEIFSDDLLLLIRADLRPLIVRAAREGLTNEETAELLGVSQKRLGDYRATWARLARSSRGEQIAWLRQQSDFLRRRAKAGDHHLADSAADFERTAAKWELAKQA